MSDFSQKVPLGRTGLVVSRLGIGSSYGVPSKACLKAFDAGVNYFFWGSVRTPEMALAIREIACRHRQDLVVVLQVYARSPFWLARSVEKGLRTLRIEQADILLLGWYQDAPAVRFLEGVERLRERGLFRFLGISSHNRPLLRELLRDGHYDVFHLRYNAAHRGAETEIFPHLPAREGPGIVSFTNTRWGDLLKERNMPPGVRPPTAVDCYRFVLTSPHVHVAICGPKNEQEMDHALETLSRGPMDEDELARMRAIGDHVHGISSFMSVLT